MRQADGDQVGPQRQLPRVPGLPRVPQHHGGREEPRRHVGEGPAADHRRDLRDVRRADDDQARPVRQFLACTRYPDCKTTKPISLGVKCPQAGLRRVHRREAVAPRQAVLRLLELGEEAVRLRGVGQAVPQPCPTCNAKFVVKKESKAGTRLRCLKPECDYTADAEAEASEGGSSRRLPRRRRKAQRPRSVDRAPAGRRPRPCTPAFRRSPRDGAGDRTSCAMRAC